MQRLVHVLGPASPAAHTLVLDPTAAAINPLNPESLSLAEDGLALLLVLLRNCPSAPPPAAAATTPGLSPGGSMPPPLMDPAAAAAAAGPLLEVAPILAAAMAASTEHIKLGLATLTSMMLLGGAPFLRNYAQVWGCSYIFYLCF